jgi:hypothetical protein|mmetsp:Transcript_23564/g.28966  ORF Transcript_23564/g.28966 Transcript_23564/m.28966 type:complete len:84 (+) Transcript_23564:104-355(+)
MPKRVNIVVKTKKPAWKVISFALEVLSGVVTLGASVGSGVPVSVIALLKLLSYSKIEELKEDEHSIGACSLLGPQLENPDCFG